MKKKKITAALLLAAVMLTSSIPVSTALEPGAPGTPAAIAAALWNDDAFTDSVFTGPETVTGFDAYRNSNNRAHVKTTNVMPDTSLGAGGSGVDMKYVFHTENHVRVANMPDGYAVTLPKPVTLDFSRSALRSRYFGEDYILHVSLERRVGGSNNINGWRNYINDYFSVYFDSEEFQTANGLSNTRPLHEYVTAEGHTVRRFSVQIDNRPNIEYPYYNIAAVLRSGQNTDFVMIHYKSKTADTAQFDGILDSLRLFARQGTARSDQTPFVPVISPSWSDETKAYYQKLLDQDTVDWGFYNVGVDDAGGFEFDYNIGKIRSAQNALQIPFEHKFEILPTYSHLGRTTATDSFPFRIAAEVAGGNGFNGKPVIQFSYQFTATNNHLGGYTPMYDIINGDYDNRFRQLARDIKAYGKPVLFRLNNEMDTDWTCYSAIVSMLDTDIFAMSWERLYNIFEEEGVDNCIWVFNPNGSSFPIGNWGSWLNYLPRDMKMVHILGITDYEMGNGTPESITGSGSFANRYQTQYNTRISPYFVNFPVGIGEFGCGAGGEVAWQDAPSPGSWVPTERFRNRTAQATWVRDMFNVLNVTRPVSVRNIKYAVWFSANDYNPDGRVTNQLRLEAALTDTTFEAFRIGFAGQIPNRVRTIGGIPVMWTGSDGTTAVNAQAAEVSVPFGISAITAANIVTAAAAEITLYSDAYFTVPLTLPLTLHVGLPADLFIKSASSGSTLFYKAVITREAAPFVTADYLNLRKLNEWESRSGGAAGSSVTVSENPVGADGGLVFQNKGGGWPSALAWASTPLSIPKAEWGDYTLHYDLTVDGTGDGASIDLIAYRRELRFTNYLLNDVNTRDDLPAADYYGSVNLQELLDFYGYRQDFFEPGGIRVVVTAPNDRTVTIREMRLTPAIPPSGDNCIYHVDRTVVAWSGDGLTEATAKEGHVYVSYDTFTLSAESVAIHTMAASAFFSDASFSVPQTMPLALTPDVPVDLYIKITAENDSGMYYKLTVTRSSLTDAQAVAAVKAALTWDTIRGNNADQNRVTANLLLPITGEYDVRINWSSDSNRIFGGGFVFRPGIGQPDAAVTLTATLRKGNVTDTVVFNLTVLASLPVPDAPVNLTAFAGNGLVILNWTPPANDGGTPIILYELTHGIVGSHSRNWTAIPDSGAGTNGYAVTGLVNGEEYVFTVRAVSENGTGLISDAAFATPEDPSTVWDYLTLVPDGSWVSTTENDSVVTVARGTVPNQYNVMPLVFTNTAGSWPQTTGHLPWNTGASISSTLWSEVYVEYDINVAGNASIALMSGSAEGFLTVNKLVAANNKAPGGPTSYASGSRDLLAGRYTGRFTLQELNNGRFDWEDNHLLPLTAFTMDGWRVAAVGAAPAAVTVSLLRLVYTEPKMLPSILTSALPDGTEGAAYSQTLVSGGDGPVIWSVASGMLPAGLTLSPAGVISGTPSEWGTSVFTVRASNSAGTITRSMSVSVEIRLGHVLNRDTVTVADASLAFRGLLGLAELTERQEKAAALDGGELTIGHVLRIFRFALGLSDSL
jgi:hypothetical protein